MRASWCALAIALAISAPLGAAARAERLPDADPQALVEAAEEQAASEENVVRVPRCFYVVTKGDTIEGVADYFGIPVSLIQTYNDWVGVVRKFEVGMKLHIPAVKDGRQDRCVSEEVRFAVRARGGPQPSVSGAQAAQAPLTAPSRPRSPPPAACHQGAGGPREEG